MTEVIPAIITKNFKHLEDKVALVKDFVEFVQVDITDGKFTHNITWPYNTDQKEFVELLLEERGLPFWEEVDYEVHLMIEKPEETVDQWIKIGASRIILQYEAVTDMQGIIDQCKAAQVQVGIALKPSTDVSVLEAYIDQIDCIQCMGNEELGRHGSPLDVSVLEKIKTLREKYPGMNIAIDIGVHPDTVHDLVDAGANILVAGSAIFDAENIEQTIRDFEVA